MRKNTVLSILVISLVTSALCGPRQAEAFDLTLLPNILRKINAIEEPTTTTETPAIPADDRPARIDAYYAKRGMPLEGYGEQFVKIADKYGLDWRLLPAIAVRESSGGKHLLNNNPFGWGSCRIKFAGFNEAIEEVGKNLAGADEDTARYYKGKTVYQILWAYNGTVIHSYPDEVIGIMEMM